MAFPNSLSGRMEELRFPSLRSPDSDSFANNATPTRGDTSYFSTVASSNDSRGSLQRRFTTDSSKMSQAKPFGAQYGGMSAQSVSFHTQTKEEIHHTFVDAAPHYSNTSLVQVSGIESNCFMKIQAQQKSKQQKWEEIQLMKRKAEEQLRLVAMQEHALKTNGEESELDTISSRLGRASLNGPVSEPTTPPEYAEGGFSSSRYSRSSRLSANSIMSPPGFGNRLSQNSSQIASPATRLSGSMHNQNHRISAKSMPVSRRGSDEEEDYPEALPSIPPPSRYVNFITCLLCLIQRQTINAFTPNHLLLVVLALIIKTHALNLRTYLSLHPHLYIYLPLAYSFLFLTTFLLTPSATFIVSHQNLTGSAMADPKTPDSGNRYSMPVGSTRSQHRYSMGTTPRTGFNVPINTSFLDDSDGDYLTLNGLDLKSPIAQTFAQLQGDDTFPTLTSDGSKVSYRISLTSLHLSD